MTAGGMLLVGSFGVWRGNDPGSQKITLDKRQILSDEQRVALRTRIHIDQKAAEGERRRTADRAAQRAAAMWARLATSGESEYLTRKHIAPHGIRFSESGSIILPLQDVHGKIHGLQAIYPQGHPKRARLGRDKDFWPKGLAKQGHFFLIGSPAATGICLVAEGYATGASVHEATGLPVAVAFDAGNLVHVVSAMKVRWPQLRLLICADDDYLGKCRECNQLTLTVDAICSHCGKEHRATNAGIAGAQAAALACDGAWLAPHFSSQRPADRKGPTDFNDLHVAESLGAVSRQIDTLLSALAWKGSFAAPTHRATGAGGDGDGSLRSVTTLEALMERYALVYEVADVVFDSAEHKLVPLSSMRNLCAGRQLFRWWMESPDKRVARLREVGFDPSERDQAIKYNLWAGWPTQPKAGTCSKLLDLGEYLCSLDDKAAEMWAWLQCWLAYPIQHPGAKMKTAVVMHGPQGTGKNLFFEAVVAIYGEYGRLLNQSAVDDKFNDWASCLLFGVADEMVSREEMYHSKNMLKTLVTGDSVRINPKNLASHYERNHVQIVFLSNEVQPMALERDDRRYAVIWTPSKWGAEMYNAVLSEIRAGGVEALHEHLLHLDLSDFGPATLPPMTQAKADLIELGMDSSERFFVEWTKQYTALPVVSCRTEDLYQAYRYWCTLQGVGKPAQLSTCVGGWSKRPGARKVRERHYLNHSHTTLIQSQCLHPPGVERPASVMAQAEAINTFNQALRDWKESTNPEPRKGMAQQPARQTAGRDDDDAPY
jgi:putative DNA primase/helicase